MRSLLCALLSVSLVTAPLYAQPGRTPAGPEPASPEQLDRFIGPHLSAGVVFMSLGEDGFDPGFGVGIGFGVRLDRRVAINGSFDWGFTEFERTSEWWDKATALGGATSDGYRAVTRWAGDCDGDYQIFCFMGAFVAYVVLLAGYAGAGVLYAGGPLASTGFLGLDLTASYELGTGRLGTRLELGASSMVLFPREYSESISAIGPTAGVTIRADSLRLGAQLTWLPSAVHLSGGGDRAAAIGMLTIGTEY